MINSDDARMFSDSGMSFICSWCEHLHNASDRGGEISCGKKCGGPAVRRSFPLYKGPLERCLDKFCFLCGGNPTAIVSIGDGVVGVCNRKGPNGLTHVDILKKIIEMDGSNIAVREVVVPKIGNE